jgi:hypothetical protein
VRTEEQEDHNEKKKKKQTQKNKQVEVQNKNIDIKDVVTPLRKYVLSTDTCVHTAHVVEKANTVELVQCALRGTTTTEASPH